VYTGEHGDCNVPQGWAEDPQLSTWVATQRKCKKQDVDGSGPNPQMTAARMAKLDALGFAWDKCAPVAWEENFAKLEAYKGEYGDCNVPQRWAEDPQLGTWVTKQRHCKKRLERGEPNLGMTVARAAKLDALGFAWSPATSWLDKWEAWLARLKLYKAAHGDCNVPQRWAEDPQLGTWVLNQRQAKKRLDRGELSPRMTAARMAKLDALGFAWDQCAPVAWEENFAKLVAYKGEYGDCNVPQRWAEDPQLANWVATQRKCKKGLDRGELNSGMTAARVAKLGVLGFTWVPHRGRPWQGLMEFRAGGVKRPREVSADAAEGGGMGAAIDVAGVVRTANENAVCDDVSQLSDPSEGQVI
jgi:hypothetical protein